MAREPLEMLIRILCNGGTIKFGGYEYGMSSGGDLIYCFSNDDWLTVDYTLRGLKNMADQIGKEELWLKCCELSLGDE